ncbi:MAG TPA: polymer-forming cytoskeletal protein [Solirubrobacteraceae bacterium]|nr:polymer-forming cytoskeletal protein [Solirubrobacteraceae bacterium]
MRRCLLIATLVFCWLLPLGSASAAAPGGDDGDRIVLVGSVLVDHDETAGDVVVVDGDVLVRGTVTGDLIVVSGDVTIRGTVAGDVVVVSGLATLGRAARVSGDLVYADDRPILTPGARVEGDVQRFAVGDASIIGAIGTWIVFTVSLLVLGLVLLLLAPRAGAALAATARAKALVSAIVGLLAFFLLPIIAIALVVTIIGLPLGIVLLLLILPLYAFGYLTSALVIGSAIRKQGGILAFVIGLIILQLLGLIPIAGGIIGLLAILFGLGVLLVALVRARTASPVASTRG